MAQNTDITLTAGVWTLLTNSDTPAATVQNRGGYTVYIKPTVGAVAPTSLDGALALNPLSGFTADLPLASIWPGVSGANRLYALCYIAATVMVSHV